MAESMPAEASRLRVLRLEWLVGGQQCGGFGGGQASHGVHEPTFFRGPPGLERRVAPGKCSHLLSNLLAAGSESIGSDLLALKGWKKASQRFSRRPLPTAVWSSLAVEMCTLGGMLAAVFTLIMFRAKSFHSHLQASSHQRMATSQAGWYSYSLKPGPQGARLERRTVRSVSLQNDVCG